MNLALWAFSSSEPEYRGVVPATHLWHTRRRRLLDRLRPGASIGMDGVLTCKTTMPKVDSRARIALCVFALKQQRNQHLHQMTIHASVPWMPFHLSSHSITTHLFSAFRPNFLTAWIAQPNALALGYLEQGNLQGYGVVRRCRDGCKIGPLFADNGAMLPKHSMHILPGLLPADRCFSMRRKTTRQRWHFVQRQQMVDVFGCARMYLGPARSRTNVFSA